MITRQKRHELVALLDQFPAVALLGPRQIGKTTLALELGDTRPSLYLDLEDEADRAKLASPAHYLAEHQDKLIILDEVQRVPELFQSLRGIIDKNKRAGRKASQFLLLGSASLDLLQQSGESLAGRIAYCELFPITPVEYGKKQEQLWLRGGFPDSLLAANDASSLLWRKNFIRTYLERDIPQLGPRIPAETLRRFWTLLAHLQGTHLNASSIAAALGVDGKTVMSYLDLLVDLLLVRRLPPLHRNLGKRLIKAPKIYIRDSGILHALLGIADRDALLGNPIQGFSWEGFVLENLFAVTDGSDRTLSFYRTSSGNEIDVVLERPGKLPWAIEIKRSQAPVLSKGLRIASADIGAERNFIVYPGTDRYRVADDTEVISLQGLLSAIV
jgi:uncharacterized protein